MRFGAIIMKTDGRTDDDGGDDDDDEEEMDADGVGEKTTGLT